MRPLLASLVDSLYGRRKSCQGISVGRYRSAGRRAANDHCPARFHRGDDLPVPRGIIGASIAAPGEQLEGLSVDIEGGVLAVGSLLDIWLYCVLGNSATISQTVLWLSRACFLVPMAFGWICGHFFWPRGGEIPWIIREALWSSCCFLVALWLAFALMADDGSAGTATAIYGLLSDHSTVPFAYGYICGHFLTPQTDIKRKVP